MMRAIVVIRQRSASGRGADKTRTFLTNSENQNKFDNNYADRYANECAYREDTRRQSNGVIFKDILGRCAYALILR